MARRYPPRGDLVPPAVTQRTAGHARPRRLGSGEVAGGNETEVREIVSDDPSLSPEANRVLTEEARDAVGADRVRVPRDKPHAERERHGDHSSSGEAFSANRILIAITFFALSVVGAIVAPATGSWWASSSQQSSMHSARPWC